MILPLLASVMVVGACTSKSVELDTAQHEKIVAEDRRALQEVPAPQAEIPQNISLSIEDALKIAVRENLDAHVSALEYLGAQDNVTLEKIQALPSMQYAIKRSGRSNQPASSSLSILTEQQSLEPSVSQERYNVTRDMTLNWNLIDAANALVSGKTASDQAQISEERYKKVIQNIHRDVYSAYWRAWAGNADSGETDTLIQAAKTYIANLDLAAKERLISKAEANAKKAPYQQSIKALNDLQNETAIALIELKSLLNLPQATNIMLTSKLSDPAALVNDIASTDIETLEKSALLSRPEMREAFLNKNISIRDTKQEIIRTLPGADLFFGFSQDTNKFLANQSWRAYSASLVQSITSLITLPDRYQIARRNEDLTETRRVTLAAAIMTQLHISRHGLTYAQDVYNVAMQEQKDAQYQAYAVQKKMHAGHAPKSEALLAKLQAQEKILTAYQAHANVHDSYAVMINTLGHEVGDTIAPPSVEMAAL